ncbi:unnamed protein product [Effrenium voratum]|uniref:Uncharacterized protein n=1 Tax=Effrenium voratum TaxID=2562239 RepID=A0AA36J947_9DINO|nr:unnamed protein product [Effrenium voratum]
MAELRKALAAVAFEGEVFCADNAQAWLLQLQKGVQAFLLDEERFFVLLLRGDGSFTVLDPQSKEDLEGQADAQLSRELTEAPETGAEGHSFRLAVWRPGKEYIQLLQASGGPVMLHLCLGEMPSLTLKRWSFEPSASGRLQVLPLWLEVLPCRLVVQIEVLLPEASMALAQSGVTRLTLGSLNVELAAQAGPITALLTPSFGPVLCLCAGHSEPSKAPQPVRVPPIFVACAAGVHCVLSHEVLSLSLPGMRAMAFGKTGLSWHGSSCLVLSDDGFAMVHLLEKESLETGSGLPEEQRSYQLVCKALGSLPFSCTGAELQQLRPSASSGLNWLLCASTWEGLTTVLLELRGGEFRIAQPQLQVRRPKQGPVQAACCTAWPGLDWQQLCVALPGDGESRLELWQLGATQAPSWWVSLEGAHVFSSHEWPDDSELMLEGELAVLTSRGDDFSQLLDIRPDIPVELQRLEGYSLLMRHFPEQGLLLQVTENSLLVYGGEGSWELLHRQRLDPFCNHAAACKGQAFTACGAVLSRYEVSRSGITRSETKVLQDQVSALAITSSEPLCAGLWLSKVILVLDTKTLEELQRFPVPTRICSMHVVIDPGGWALWAGSAQGHLLRHSQGEGASWRLGASPLRLRPATGAAEALAVSAEGAFLLATAGDFTPCLWPSDLVFAHPCGDKKMLVLSRGSGGLVLAKAPITAKREAHRVLRSTKLCGEVLSLAFKADPPAILVLAQLSAKERRALLTLDRHLQLLALVPLEDEAKRLWPLGRPSSWLYDLSDGVLLALGHPGAGSPPTSLHKVQLPARQAPWLPQETTGKVVASLRLDTPALLAATAAVGAPVVLGTTSLRFVSSTLRSLGKCPLKDLGLERSQLQALSLTAGRPGSWPPLARAASGDTLFAFLGLAAGVMILQLKLRGEEAPACIPLRLVLEHSQMPSLSQVLAFQAPASQQPCGFFVGDASGSSIWRLDFSAGSGPRLPEGLPVLGNFWPAKEGTGNLGCVTLSESQVYLFDL